MSFVFALKIGSNSSYFKYFIMTVIACNCLLHSYFIFGRSQVQILASKRHPDTDFPQAFLANGGTVPDTVLRVLSCRP
jgi:hypothetical protein